MYDKSIRFQETIETARFHLPGQPENISELTVRRREDPLTGRMSVFSDSLAEKARLFFGKTDISYLKKTAERSKNKCFFCYPLVASATPTYPSDLLPEGRIKTQNTLLFPNLFPLFPIHAVVTWPAHHFLTMAEITSDRLGELFTTCGIFIKRVSELHPEIEFISLNMNHLPPAGASVIHPHIQIVGAHTPPFGVQEILKSVRKYEITFKDSFWDHFLAEEDRRRERWIGTTPGWSWVTAYAPQGGNEIYAVHQFAQTPFDLAETDYRHLADGVSRILSEFHRQGYSSFNLTLFGGLSGNRDTNRVLMRLITRQNFSPGYRSDTYFLQRFLGMELILVSPEELASRLRPLFKK